VYCSELCSYLHGYFLGFFFFFNGSRDTGFSVTPNESLDVKRLACVEGINTVLSYPEDAYRK